MCELTIKKLLGWTKWKKTEEGVASALIRLYRISSFPALVENAFNQKKKKNIDTRIFLSLFTAFKLLRYKQVIFLETFWLRTVQTAILEGILLRRNSSARKWWRSTVPKLETEGKILSVDRISIQQVWVIK